MTNTEDITLEQVEKLYRFLQGEVPDGFDIKAMPNLSPDQAFSVIYYLQEGMRVLPDSYEKCRVEGCNELYDSDAEGCMAMLCEAHYELMCPHQGDKVECEECELYKEIHGD
ncbi:MAG: hypothetical protein A4E55_00375 [Pelotomaculum sp. PtaU1.Bin035]|nr:MAG: hypothetical protein A4E55_00375 [Pelotomaculum sp. PtaU1.Bin035]